MSGREESPRPRRLLVATTNPDKLSEIIDVLEGLPLAIASLSSVPAIVPPEETGATFEDNARLKARYYARVSRDLVVAEDSGFEIDALEGAPGVMSARYGGSEAQTYPERFARIYQALAERQVVSAAARFVCALALVRGDRMLFETRASVEGIVAPAPVGTHGFGYDPIFWYPPYGRTFGEISRAEKAAVSHRGRAFRALRGFLEQHLTDL